MTRYNEFGQPVGEPMPYWKPSEFPSRRINLEGFYTVIEPLDFKHSKDLFEAYSLSEDDRDWTYMMFGPFANYDQFKTFIKQLILNAQQVTYAIVDKSTNKAIGLFTLMRIDLSNGCIEIGNVMFSALLRGTKMSTEAHFLMMKYVFEDLEYRRYEWKCDAYNDPSRRAAARLGFNFESIFRQNVIFRGRERDTAWFAIVFGEWPSLETAFTQWLHPANFDKDGKQIQSLQALRGKQ